MRKLILKLAKNYIVKAINELLSRYSADVSVIADKIALWTDRLERIIIQLRRINERVADGRVECEEIDQSLAEVETLVRSF